MDVEIKKGLAMVIPRMVPGETDELMISKSFMIIIHCILKCLIILLSLPYKIRIQVSSSSKYNSIHFGLDFLL